MTGAEIREQFLKFFESKQHNRLPSASLIPSDPTVLLNLAGMLQFKPIFLGEKTAPASRVTTVQKCVRMNDLENVGNTARHHTFFEMLGNFSFGDYFKEEAITWCWELLTDVYKLDKTKLWAAVFYEDQEAYDIWDKKIDISKDHIIKLNEEHNFWSAGPVGPCGPCSEVYYDFGEKKGCGSPNCAPGCDCDRYLEIWNLVFMELDRDVDGNLSPLPKKNIDTGMGLERIASVMQGAETNFETDLLFPLMECMAEIAGVKTQGLASLRPESYRSLKVIADHSRAVTYLLADGVVPSNEGRGYVLRRILRRAVRHGHLLGVKESFLAKVAEKVIELGAAIYPELLDRKDFILKVINSEEETFARTLDQGIAILDKMVQAGEVNAFLLYDTFGFPLDMTESIVTEHGLKVDLASFKKQMTAQKNRARQAGMANVDSTMGGEVSVESEDDKLAMARHHSATHLLHAALREVLGSHATQAGSLVSPEKLRFDFPHYQALTKEELKKIEQLVNKEIQNASPVNVSEMSFEEAKDFGAMALFGEKYGDNVRVVKMGNFSCELCGGTHVENTSVIGPFKIIFESAISAGTRRIEAMTGSALEKYLADKKAKAIAEFKEKVLQLRELEVQIEQLEIEDKDWESGIGISDNPENLSIEALAKHNNNLVEAIKKASKELQKLKQQAVLSNLDNYASEAEDINGIKVLVKKIEDIDGNQLKALAEGLGNKLGETSIIFMASALADKALFVAMVGKSAVSKANAGTLVKTAATVTGGGGGGRPDFAQAGGKDVTKIDEALEAVSKQINESL
ncbi:MAG: alanine--tRNA ligase [Candidatus Margulisiibacteriota bacterium]